MTGNAPTRVAGALYAGLYVLCVNSKRPPLDNPLVKQALSLAIDRELIVKELWKGRGIVPSGPIAKGDNHFDSRLPALAYNPSEAKERLKKAGYKGEEVFIETTVAYVAQDKPMFLDGSVNIGSQRNSVAPPRYAGECLSRKTEESSVRAYLLFSLVNIPMIVK